MATMSHTNEGEGTPLVRGSMRDRENTLLSSKFATLLGWCIPGHGRHASVKSAWRYFEHYVLPRRIVHDDGTVSRAPPGTEGSTLYPAWTTPQRELKDFGTGIAVYFETLRALIIICLLAGILYIPSIVYYGSDGYTSKHVSTVLGPLRGSLICPEPEWVACPDCTSGEWSDSLHRIGHDNQGLIFALKNTCAPLRWAQGVNHLIVMIFVSISIFALGFYQRHLEIHYDECILTASDFSVQVDNPPPDAVQADEWKTFFEQFGEVAFVTVALNNSELLKKLTKRRVLMQKASYKLIRENAGPLQEIPSSLRDVKPILYEKIVDVQEECREMLKQEYPTSAVFVTFQKEQSQRLAIGTLKVGQVNIVQNNVDILEARHRFRGNLVLDVFEAPEPSEIRWEDLDESIALKVMQRLLTSLMTVGVIAFSFWLLTYEDDINRAAAEITLMNVLMPHLFKFINSFESHQSEGSYQASLFWKIAIFRWVNTCVVTILIKPFTETLSDNADGLVASVQAVLRAEIMIAPVLHMLDIVGFLKRQILAPRAMNQTAMNSYFRGSRQLLGEKYTNITKTVFLVFFYSAIFPSALFYGAVALCMTYVTDKFLLLRSWAPMPLIGDEVAILCRKMFFPLTVVVLAIMSEFFYSAYPCDNLCDTDTDLSDENHGAYIGKHSIASFGNDFTVVNGVLLSAGDKIYRFCQQDFKGRIGTLLNVFSEDRDDWMTGDQEGISYVVGLFAVGVVAVMVFINVREDIPVVRSEAFGGFTTTERDSGLSYIDQKQIKAYIPQCPDENFAFPLIGADLSKFDGSFVGWKDPILDYDFYNLRKDVEALGYTEEAPVLSCVCQYIKK